ncbi:GspH/FimT family pseudopilin [Pseudomonas sp. KSR10]|uniref:pilus assembly FimT family protein n=1 Tax=Pseudomonas sp. KSR10 TaxID=2916654 RepID=UPI001EF8408E|nr:GspH/FimT family pseudopilin [Pseudomonas sp. KSR10]MCG6541829.1 GspH/FimT family pseudopilin [Pseudomonas sp. KSR10]
MHRSFRQHAFSLIDLLCSLILLSILLAVAIPNLQLLIKRHEERSVREMLTAYLNDTRARAIISRRGHTLCGSSDGSTCNGDWASNWLVTAADGELLQRYQLASSADLCWRGARESIEFHPNGTTLLGNGRFSFCRSDGVAWQLVLNRQGRLRLADNEGSGCCSTGDTTT